MSKSSLNLPNTALTKLPEVSDRHYFRDRFLESKCPPDESDVEWRENQRHTYWYRDTGMYVEGFHPISGPQKKRDEQLKRLSKKDRKTVEIANAERERQNKEYSETKEFFDAAFEITLKQVRQEIEYAVRNLLTDDERAEIETDNNCFSGWKKNLAKAASLHRKIGEALSAGHVSQIAWLALMLGDEISIYRHRRSFEHLVRRAKRQAGPLERQRETEKAESEARKMAALTELFRRHGKEPNKKKMRIARDMEADGFGKYWTLKSYFSDVELDDASAMST